MELNSNNYHELFVEKDFYNKEILKIREKLKNNNQDVGCLSIYERKIMIIENVASYYLNNVSYNDEPYELLKEQNDIIKIALDFLDKFEYFVSPTPIVKFNNKEYPVNTAVLYKLEGFTDRITKDAFNHNIIPCIYNLYFQSTIPSKINSQFGNKVIMIRYINIDYDYKSNLINKRFSQNE